MLFKRCFHVFYIFFISFTVYAAGCEQQQCIAVVDVGSTGSRLYVYSFDLDEHNTPVAVTSRWEKKIRPGFSTLTPDKASMNQYLNTLFKGVNRKNLPVYFYATAGMRLLPVPKQQQLYALVQDWFSGQNNYQLKAAKTITGTEEGVFGWLAVNYQLGGLNGEKALTGVMDMGGASVQVVFPVQGQSGLSQDFVEIDLYGRHFTLFVHSFLGLGQMETSHQFMESESCFINDYELPSGFLAAGDAYSCENEVSSFVNTVHKVNSVVQPVISENPVKSWYVMGGLVDLLKSPVFDFRHQSFTGRELLQKANANVCHESWTFLHATYPEDDYLYGYCLFPSYYYALMMDGYGLSANQKIHYLKDNQSSNWTLGVVLNSFS